MLTAKIRDANVHQKHLIGFISFLAKTTLHLSPSINCPIFSLARPEAKPLPSLRRSFPL